MWWALSVLSRGVGLVAWPVLTVSLLWRDDELARAAR